MQTTRLSEADRTELTLDSYLMHIHHTSCCRCNSGEQYSDLYEVWVHPTKTRTTGYRDLRPMRSGFLRDLPVARLELPHRLIPICSDCIDTYVSRTAQTATTVTSSAAWAETLKRKYTPEPTAPVKVARSAGASADKTIPAPTPDQL